MSILSTTLTNTPSGSIAGLPATEASYFIGSYNKPRRSSLSPTWPWFAMSGGPSPKHNMLGVVELRRYPQFYYCYSETREKAVCSSLGLVRSQGKNPKGGIP